MDKIVENKIRGVIYGGAIGDALGFGTECVSKRQIAQEYPNGLRYYSQISRYQNIRGWVPGDWTDDTDQMLCILDSLLEKQQVDILDIAARFYQWAIADGMGMGRTVYSVVYSPNFLQNPHLVAQEVWEASGCYAAANGAVMRTSILGIWQYTLREQVKRNAEQVCKITHYDPRCVGSCVAVCLAIRDLLCGETDLEAMIEAIAKEVTLYHPEIHEYFDKVNESLESLQLDAGLDAGTFLKIGYTLKTIAAGFWTLLHAYSFEDGLLKIIHEGGDADTNAAVAGALLGAKFGYNSIPKYWIEELVYKRELDKRVEQLINLSQQWSNLQL